MPPQASCADAMTASNGRLATFMWGRAAIPAGGGTSAVAMPCAPQIRHPTEARLPPPQAKRQRADHPRADGRAETLARRGAMAGTLLAYEDC
jgi:hypothetical protein